MNIKECHVILDQSQRGISYVHLCKNTNVKCRKCSNVKFANFLYFCIMPRKVLPLCGNAFSCITQKYTKFASFTLLYFRRFIIFYIFTTKLQNFTKFRMLFPTVLKLFSNLKVCLIEEWSIVSRAKTRALIGW